MTDALAKIDALLDEGVRFLHSGDPIAAEAKFRQVLEVATEDSEALTFLGVSLQHQERSIEARDVLKQALLFDDTSPDAHYNLAEVSLVLDDLGQAELHYQRCVELEPSNAIAWRRLSEVRAKRQDQAGAAEAAEKAQQQEGDSLLPGWTERLLSQYAGAKRDLASLQRDAAEKPDDLTAQIQLYRAAASAQDAQTFETAMSRALRIAPLDRNVLADQINLLLRLKCYERAAVAAARLVEQFPAEPKAYITLICVSLQRHDLTTALKTLDKLVELKPDDPSVYFNVAFVLAQMGRTREAEPSLRRAIELRPESINVRLSLSVCLEGTHRRDEAIAEARIAIEKGPKNLAALDWLATLLGRAGKHSDAFELRKRILEIEPKNLASIAPAGLLLFEQTRTDEAWALLQQGMAIAPDDPQAFGTALLYGNAHPDLDAAELYQLHKKWAQVLHRKLPAPYETWTNDRDPERRLRVGYLTPDARAHSVSYFLEPLLKAHDRSRIEPIMFDNVVAPDIVTEHFKKFMPAWYRIVGMDNKRAAELIRELEVDILVDLVGHTSHSRMGIFALHPAPVQVNYLGYPNTTGLAEMDYRITDAICDPPGESDRFHTEKLVRLPGGFLSFIARSPHPNVGMLPAVKNGFITFASFNASHKINRKVIQAWSRLLERVPQSRMIFKAGGMSDRQTQANIVEEFVRNGISEDRLEFIERTRHYFDHLQIYNRCDIALDTFPYNGTTTTCEAIFMGVPVITFTGDRHAARVSSSILSRLNLSELIGTDADDMVERGVRLANNPARLLELRANLRGLMQRSRLMDAKAQANEMEAAYRQMWRAFCEG